MYWRVDSGASQTDFNSIPRIGSFVMPSNDVEITAVYTSTQNTSTGNSTSSDPLITSGFGGDILKAVNSLEDGDPMITNTLSGAQETLIEWDFGEDVQRNTFRLYDYFYGDPGSSPAMGRLSLMYRPDNTASWNLVNFTEQRYVNGKSSTSAMDHQTSRFI